MAANTHRPLIGINCDLYVNPKTRQMQARVPAGYYECVLNAGGLPILMPPYGKDNEIERFLDRVEGMVMIGGLDLDPRRRGEPMHSSITLMAEKREVSDTLLMKQVLERQIPLLAIGAGMQLLNVLQGGTLYTHLPEDMPRAMPHYDPAGGPHRHIVVMEPKSRMEEIYGEGELRVNSTHHQAIKTVGKGLRVGARSPDGVIEAVEWEEDGYFCVGVQWHPEADTASALDMQVFEAFLQSCGRVVQPLQLAA